jgi:arabinofuranosyltransferase
VSDRLANHRGLTAIILTVGLIGLSVVLIRTAWLSDDAFISFRTADNFVHGYGLRWNVDERVQAYTHPLWLGLFTAAYVVTGEPYYTAIALGFLLTVLGVTLTVGRLAATPWNALAYLCLLVSSKAFVDFSTSGLENALTHVLLGLFLWRWFVEPAGVRRTLRLTLLASMCLLNRLDLMLLLGPVLAVEIWHSDRRAAVPAVVAGLLPLVAWEVFSLVYYGFLFPNTAYAKLNTGIPESVLFRRGVLYALATGLSDPVTMAVVIATPLIVAFTAQPRIFAGAAERYSLAAGAGLYALYITWVGGDFMIGRFYTPLFVWAATLLAASSWPRGVGLTVASAALVLGLMAPDEPALLSGYNSTMELREEAGGKQRRWWLGEAFDERRVYYMDTGLLKQRAGHPTPAHEGAFVGLKWRQAGVTTVTFPTIGFAGYFAGPGVHVIDPYALADPVLARLPAQRKFRVGHYERHMPEGYPETVSSGVNRISDPGLAAYYDHMRLIVSGPLWTRARWRAIADELTGREQDRLRQYVATLPFPAHY